MGASQARPCINIVSESCIKYSFYELLWKFSVFRGFLEPQRTVIAPWTLTEPYLTWIRCLWCKSILVPEINIAPPPGNLSSRTRRSIGKGWFPPLPSSPPALLVGSPLCDCHTKLVPNMGDQWSLKGLLSYYWSTLQESKLQHYTLIFDL